MKRKHFLQRMFSGSLPVLLLAGGLLASCDKEDMTHTEGTPLPEGKYPLVLTASVGEMQTRSAGKDTWTENDAIGVRIGDAGAKVGKYLVSTDLSTRPADEGEALYWQNTAPATIIAWYPYEAKNDVDISNQKAGYTNFDYLTAIAENKSYKDKGIELQFKHRMAKVKYTLTHGEGVNEETLQNAAVAISGYTKATFSEGVLTSSESENGWITPTVDGEALLVPQDMSGKPFIKVSATVDGTPREFVYTPTGDAAILENGKVHTYNITVLRDKIAVQPGQSVAWGSGSGMNGENPETVAYHSLNLKYDAAKLDGSIVVTDNATGGEITIDPDGTYHLPSAKTGFTITYKPRSWMDSFVPTAGLCYMNRTYDSQSQQYKAELTGVISDIVLTLQEYAAVGDYYYSDGTWAVMDNAYGEGEGVATSIGVVFHVGAGADDHISHYDQPEGTEILGYVVAKSNLPGNPDHPKGEETGLTSWGGTRPESGWELTDLDVPELENFTGNISSFNGISYDGYARTKIIREKYLTKPETYSFPAFEACDTYQEQVAAPQEGKSSSWYIPSAAMLGDINKVRNQANMTSGNLLSSTESSLYGVVGFYYHGKTGYTGRDKNDNGTYARAVITIFKQKK